MKAYHNDSSIKEKYLARVRAHREADEILQGFGYWEDGKECAVGCTLHSSKHDAYETELGIPVRLAYLEDSIFEGLPVDLAKSWPERFLNAIPVGADLEKIWPQYAIWLLESVSEYSDEVGKKAIETVIDLYERILNGEEVTDQEWAAEDAADAARAARAAAAAAEAAEAAARAAWAAWAAEDAADAAGAAEDAAEAAWKKQADKLIELLKEAPVNN